MRILLFSDTHGYNGIMEKAAGANKGIDLVIHLGDYVRDAMKFEETHENIRHEYVPGNNDWIKENPPDRVLLLEGKRIFVTHGHHYNVKMTFSRLASVLLSIQIH